MPVSNVTESINDVTVDAKTGVRNAEHQLEVWTSQLANPDPMGVLEIHGRKYVGSDRFGVAATLDLNRGTEEMQNQVSAFMSLLTNLFSMEKSLMSSSS